MENKIPTNNTWDGFEGKSIFINGCIFSSIQCFFGLILCCSQSGDDPQDDLAMFGYKLNMKAIFFKDILLYFWLPT